VPGALEQREDTACTGEQRAAITFVFSDQNNDERDEF
jgi:hypothetical protein